MLKKAFFANSFGTLVSRIFGFIRDIMTAAILGAGVWSDIFFVAFKLPNLFRRLFGEGAFTQAFLPGFVRVKKKGLFAASVLSKFVLFILVITVFVVIFAPFVTKTLAFGFDKNTINLAIPYVRINFFYLTFIFVVTLFASMLQYKGHFATTAFSTALLNISMIVSLFLARDLSDEKVVLYLSIGVVVGGVLQALVHIIALKRTNMLRVLVAGFKGLKKGKKADTKGFYKGFYNGVLGSSVLQLGSFLDTWLASFLMAGSISYLYYANRIFQLPLALFAIALSTAIFPSISKQIKNSNFKSALNLLGKNFYILFFLLLGSAVGGIMLSYEITWLLFQRGEFNAQNTIECSKVLSMYMVGLVPFGLAKLFSLWLYSKMRQDIAAKIAIKTLILSAILSVALIHPLKASGLALASSLSGFFLLYLNIKAFGFENFLAIINTKKISLILLLILCEIIILLIFKGLIDGFIR
ncbi:MAG: murein biosynthesis integral membrane protein MurJ [Campylobacter sp.]|nr:murein biosynthesis integral membrane protein MurJ [Campylobacter sp.]